MTEPAVIAHIRSFLTKAAFPEGTSVVHLVTDAHPTLLGRGDLGPYQRIRATRHALRPPERPCGTLWIGL